jgi:hypothetical protein
MMCPRNDFRASLRFFRLFVRHLVKQRTGIWQPGRSPKFVQVGLLPGRKEYQRLVQQPAAGCPFLLASQSSMTQQLVSVTPHSLSLLWKLDVRGILSELPSSSALARKIKSVGLIVENFSSAWNVKQSVPVHASENPAGEITVKTTSKWQRPGKV